MACIWPAHSPRWLHVKNATNPISFEGSEYLPSIPPPLLLQRRSKTWHWSLAERLNYREWKWKWHCDDDWVKSAVPAGTPFVCLKCILAFIRGWGSECAAGSGGESMCIVFILGITWHARGGRVASNVRLAPRKLVLIPNLFYWHGVDHCGYDDSMKPNRLCCWITPNVLTPKVYPLTLPPKLPPNWFYPLIN